MSYADTRERQIICPACSEAVFKVGSAITGHGYFSHYRAKPDSDGELRVLIMIRERGDIKELTPRGQELDKFLAKFEQIMLEGDEAAPAILKVTKPLLPSSI